MGLSRSRTITLVVACSTLSANVLCSLLFHHLPDDPYQLAAHLGWYLHFANVASVFGLVGVLRQHAQSVSFFAHYLILDAILSAVPRFIIVTILSRVASTSCESLVPSYSLSTQTSLAQSSSTMMMQQSTWTSDWSPEAYAKILSLGRVTLAAGVIAATILQFVGALYVREYGKALWVRDCWAEARAVLNEERRRNCEIEYGLHIIDEEAAEMVEKL